MRPIPVASTILRTRGRCWAGVVLISTLVTGGTVWAQNVPLLGPEDFLRQGGKPQVVVREFSTGGATAPFLLRIENGGSEDQFSRVSSAVVILNGAVVAGPEAFNQTVEVIETAVTLEADNVLSVEVRGKPGSGFTLPFLVSWRPKDRPRSRLPSRCRGR